ncbi:uncharacterized protein LOC143018733 [Oratosquilla oratoria]|uniref:uncharacterized protein LOC143018733 n=1 Tax=Oratosquilla oratoria TaxID=337810 RepID=UPI003F774422
MVYQEHLTKFCVLRPLTSKRAAKSQGSVERANCDIKDMLVAWLGDNQTTDWTVGLKFVQLRKNKTKKNKKPSYHSGIKRSPFAALFGSDAKVGLTTSALPHDVIHRLQSEDDLLSVITDKTTSVEPPDVEPPSVEPTSPFSVRQNNIISQRKRACEAQLSQAERRIKRSRRIMDRGNVGNNVTIPLSMVNRSRGDSRNIKGMIVDIDENDNYTIAVKSGILRAKYTRNQFDLCTYELHSEDDVTADRIVSLRSALQQESKSGGQGSPNVTVLVQNVAKQIDVNVSSSRLNATHNAIQACIVKTRRCSKY